ncbi:amino acid adenylation domain-containing protein [Streptomyces sp. NBC_01803]|uniref:amino acid adenylation domain-containing protein n=1 Tax=Streptomyces sp. NBC_01803 TaxID=2975946 RepID=UPI002DDC0086|nr:amino acid adenylation domain-containing protein [Streptomyces sp. NBC_01803]WSA43064.1 amino acid adenylation domain-containing protein [Streptomyces sp. NBC_01803]
MTDLDARLAALTPEQRARFEKLLAERGLTETESVFPLSVLQRGMWFLEQLRPHNPAYLVPGAVDVRGRLDIGVLRAAVNEIVRRHEALRTTFGLRDGVPAQIVRGRLDVDVPELDLSDAAFTEDDRRARIAAELAEPFDLTAGPLLRVTLVRTGPEESVLLLAMHHLVSDRWSMGVFLTELSELYEAFAQGQPSPLPVLDVQYGDFASWQHQRLTDGGWAADLAYWRDRLHGAPAVLALPTDRPRPAVQGFDGGSVPVELPEPLMRELGALAGRHGATPYMALLAVFQILLHRYSGQDDVVVGVPVAVRDRAELEPLIGYFVNTLPIRTDLAGDPSFTEVLGRVRDSCLGAYAHQDVPFELVVADLNTARDLSRPPVYQVSFSYGREPVPTLALGGAELTRMPVRSAGSRFDLELQAFDAGGALSGWFDYDRDLFEESTVARLAGHFRRLAEQVAARPDTPVVELELLDDAERRRVLTEVNDTDRAWPDDAGWLHECVEERARSRPDAEAVRFEGRSMDYAGLNARANRLARLLRRHGVGRDVLVGVAMERSFELVVSLLAILKAGGAYVPLDPELPPARLEFMLRDAAAPVLLTRRPVLDGLPPAGDCQVLDLDALADELAAESPDDLGVAVDGEDLAYVIYTSGSTGRPKGVMNVHAAIRNRLLWMQDAYRLDTTDRVLQKTPFSFDVSVWEFFWPLMTGATLVVARPRGHRDGAYLAEVIRAERVTTAHFVPSMLQVFLQEDIESCTALRRVVCSGEELPRALQNRFLARSGAQLHNLYGPTEAAIDVTAWTCRDDGDPRPVPIGFPIANTRMYVLDRRLRPVPAGVPGELHIGGRNLARGYLNQPGLTAERFIDDPVAPAPGARLYRTGDLARFRSDGALEFLGRLDHQVKLRGFRVEPGEIEAVLAGHPGVREALVVAREHGADDVRLAAYLTAGPDGPPGVPELTAHLRERLPEYMVPSSFTVLPAFPLTSSGKADRKALPEPQGLRPDLGTRFVAPQDGLEDTLAGLWRELLGVERVGSQDNFFDLGGHSLLMAQLRARLAATVGHEPSMVELFQHPTVGSLAAYLSRSEGPRTGSPGGGARERAESRRQSRNRRQQAADRRALSRGDR